MRNFLFTIFSVALATIFTACSSSTAEDIATLEENEGAITATMSQYKVDDTRTTHIFSSTGMSFSWEESDILGCFPTTDNEEMRSNVQPLTPKAITNGGQHIDFGTAKTVNILPNKEYTAYFKYDVENAGIKYTAIPVSYVGQTQGSNVKIKHATDTDVYMNSEKLASKHLGDYNYMTSGTVPSAEVSAAINFDMQQIQSIVRFYIKVPADLNFSRIDVVNKETEFITEGTIDLTDRERTITKTNSSKAITLSLNGDGFDFRTGNDDYKKSGSGYIIAYMMVAPVTLTDNETTLYLTGTDGSNTKCFKASLAKKSLSRGKAYQWSVNSQMPEDPIILDEVTVEEWQKATGYENENGKGTETW